MDTTLGQAAEQALQLEELCASMIFLDHPNGGNAASHTPEGPDFWGQAFELAQELRHKLETKWMQLNPITIEPVEIVVLPGGQIIGKEKDWKSGGAGEAY